MDKLDKERDRVEYRGEAGEIGRDWTEPEAWRDSVEEPNGWKDSVFGREENDGWRGAVAGWEERDDNDNWRDPELGWDEHDASALLC